jgi:hypothetical protein
MNINHLSTETVNVLEMISCAITDYMAWEEVGAGASAIEEGFVIHLN